jgi:hypothetical protein
MTVRDYARRGRLSRQTIEYRMWPNRRPKVRKKLESISGRRKIAAVNAVYFLEANFNKAKYAHQSTRNTSQLDPAIAGC